MKKFLRLFIPSILAGISIALGGYCFLSVENKLIGSILFSVGLFLVCTRGYNLYTGKVCYCKTKEIINNTRKFYWNKYCSTSFKMYKIC